MSGIRLGSGKPRLLPSDFMRSYTARRGKRVEDIGVGDLVLLVFDRQILVEVVEATSAELSKLWIYGESRPLYNGQVEGRKVTLFSPDIGAPATVMHMEELIASGARFFISYGAAGSIQEDLEAGEFVLITDAVREEGTSFHYLPPEALVHSSETVSNILLAACRKNGVDPHLGATWTIDAPYRETEDKIIAYSKVGVLTVEMECSAMFALGAVRGVEVGTLLLVSDEMTQPWTPENMRMWAERRGEAAQKVPSILMDAVKMFPQAPSAK